MKNKLLAAILCATVLLTACGSNEAAPASSAAPAATQAAQSAETEAAAETAYPEKNVSFIIPYSAGGGTDSLMRLLTSAMETDLGQTFVVSNKEGGLGQVGLTELAAAKNDGYTIGALSNLDHVLVLLTGENVAYDYDSFECIGAINTTVNVLMASEESGFKSLDDLVAYAKENPGSVTVSISGMTHIAEVALFEKAAGIDLTTVMQNGGGDSLNAVLGGHVDCAVLDKKFVAQVEGQNVTTLASFGSERLDVISEIPTMSELGYDVSTETYRVIVAPKGTPEDVLEVLEASIKRVSEDPAFQETMTGMSEVYRYLDREQVKERLDKDYEAMKTLLEENPDALSQ